MADQDERAKENREEADDAEDTEGHGLMGGPKPPVTSGNPTGDDSPIEDDRTDGITPKKIIPKH